MARILICDGAWFIHRAYFVAGLRKDFRFLDKSIPRLFLNMVIKDASILQTPYIAVTFDAPNSFRYKIYPRYKANRKGISIQDMLETKGLPVSADMPKIDPYTYMPHTKRVLTATGIFWIVVDQMEGDDLFAAAAKTFGDKHKVYLATKDKDMLSLVNDNVSVYWPASGKKEYKILNAKEVEKYKGVRPDQMRDFLCLTGDKVDNIPGVPGISDKNAIKILKKHGSIGACLKSNTKEGRKLKEHMSRLHLARKLVNLNANCWSPKLSDLRLRDTDEKRLVNILGDIPKSLNELHAQSALANTKGLFR
jgi:DNA polymerase-1